MVEIRPLPMTTILTVDLNLLTSIKQSTNFILNKMSSARTEIITVRKIKGKPIVENSSDSFDIEESSNNRLDEESYGEQSEIPNNLLCILCRLGKLGAAYYNFTDKQVSNYHSKFLKKIVFFLRIDVPRTRRRTLCALEKA